jgi:hypothetical protein
VQGLTSCIIYARVSRRYPRGLACSNASGLVFPLAAHPLYNRRGVLEALGNPAVCLEAREMLQVAWTWARLTAPRLVALLDDASLRLADVTGSERERSTPRPVGV